MAAATGAVVSRHVRPGPPRPVFRADHPFFFIIRDNGTGSTLFAGRVVNPQALNRARLTGFHTTGTAAGGGAIARGSGGGGGPPRRRLGRQPQRREEPPHRMGLGHRAEDPPPASVARGGGPGKATGGR